MLFLLPLLAPGASAQNSRPTDTGSPVPAPISSTSSNTLTLFLPTALPSVSRSATPISTTSNSTIYSVTCLATQTGPLCPSTSFELTASGLAYAYSYSGEAGSVSSIVSGSDFVLAASYSRAGSVDGRPTTLSGTYGVAEFEFALVTVMANSTTTGGGSSGTSTMMSVSSMAASTTGSASGGSSMTSGASESAASTSGPSTGKSGAGRVVHSRGEGGMGAVLGALAAAVGIAAMML